MSPAKILFIPICTLGMSACSDRNGSGSPEDRETFEKTKALILEGFAKGDVKAVLAMLGRGDDVLRLPMVQVSDATRHKLEAVLSELGLLAGVASKA